jgi:hypothetical protein
MALRPSRHLVSSEVPLWMDQAAVQLLVWSFRALACAHWQLVNHGERGHHHLTPWLFSFLSRRDLLITSVPER